MCLDFSNIGESGGYYQEFWLTLVACCFRWHQQFARFSSRSQSVRSTLRYRWDGSMEIKTFPSLRIIIRRTCLRRNPSSFYFSKLFIERHTITDQSIFDMERLFLCSFVISFTCFYILSEINWLDNRNSICDSNNITPTNNILILYYIPILFSTVILYNYDTDINESNKYFKLWIMNFLTGISMEISLLETTFHRDVEERQ